MKLTDQTWCLCTGFELGGYWFLNDATHEDGAAEYGVVKIEGPDGRPLQIESITFSWCDCAHALALIEHTLRGEDDENDFAVVVTPRIETPQEHGQCHLCM